MMFYLVLDFFFLIIRQTVIVRNPEISLSPINDFDYNFLI